NPIPRVDLMNSASLKKISINQGGHQISQEFEYGYFVKKDIKNENDQLSDLEKKYARLCLKSIEQKGENSSSGGKYAFNYFTGVGSTYPNDNIPPRLSIPTDIYGYYNYHYINEYDPSELDPNYIYPNYNILLNFLDFSSSIGGRQRNQYNPLYKNGLIQKITNPYKGTIEFEYEPNLKFDDSQASNNPYYGGARVAKTIQFDGLNHSNDIINEFKYIKPDGSCSIWGNDQANANYFNILTRQYKSPVSIKAGKMAKEFAIGLAIAIALKTNSGNQSVSSYGETAGDYYASYVWGVMINIIVSELGYMFSPDYTTIGFTNGTYFPNSFKNPLPQQFSRVEIIKRSATLNSGKTIYEFTSDQDYPIETPVYSFPFSNDYRSFNQAYGLTKKVTILNSANNKVKEIENSYDYKKNIITQTNFASQGWATLTNYTARYLDGILNINTIPNDAVTRKIYYPVTGRVELIRTVEKLYNNNGTPIASTTDYYYNSTNYQLAKTETTDSKGGVIKKLKYFPTDYNLSNLPIMQGLVNNNIINVPVSDEVWISKQIGTSEMISCSTTEFGITLNGDYKPIKEYGLQTDRPVALSVIGNFDPNQLIRNSSLIVPQSETVYNSVGNPSVLKDMKGLRNTATLYSYANRYPVASVTNATTSEVAYTSFEAFEQGFVHDNNWDISNVDVGTGVTPTGNKYCLLKASPVSSLITTNISINQEYKLSFWATSATFSVNSGALPTVTGPTIDGWTYYEFKIPPSSSGPNITGNNCKIDELRLYPKKSSMITSAYEIGIGIISECDINNRITYYEYDGLRRVSKVLDERHNIIKTYEYHFKN
ncbi:MAG TPA: hypothetical protein PKA80_14630, partial [Ignavibacteriaceae bacterium]|nr:hypothetical protein [Ignavibacteriaceae bacterium]